MSSGERFGRGDRERFIEKNREPDAEQAAGSPPGKPDPSMLEAVLNATSSESREPITKEEMDALRQVARSFLGRPFQLDPVAIALVNGILRIRLRRPNATDEFWRAISTEIATTLCDNVETNERLSRFWKRLCETVT